MAEQKTFKCPFCNKDIPEGFIITNSETGGAICYSCVGVCSSMIFSNIHSGMVDIMKEEKNAE
jgi:hypothetical protein